MLFLTKSSSARRSLLALLLALCCLSCVLGAKLSKKTEKPPAVDDNNEDKAEAEVEAEAAASAANNNKAEKEDDDEDADEEEDDDDDDDEEEEEEPSAKADKDAAVAATAPTKNKQKNEVKPATDPTDLSVWGMVRTLWGWLRSDLSESLFGDDDEKPATVEGRTFGKIRRLQMAIIPIIFKFGVLSAMVAFLVAIGMKSLFLLKVLVLMNALAILGKFLTLKTSLFGQFENSAPSFNYPTWNPHAKESWSAPTGLSNSGPPHGQPPSKEIHLHIHGNAHTQAQLANQGYNFDTQGEQGWASRSDPYSAYPPTGQFQQQQPQYAAEVPNNTNPMSLLPTKYPARNLIR